MDSICIIDFAGNSTQCGRWADHYPDQQVTTFGGYWSPVPDLHGPEPSEDAAEDHAGRFSRRCETVLRSYLGLSPLRPGHTPRLFILPD